MKRVYIDASHLFYRQYFGCIDLVKEREENVVNVYLNGLFQILKKFGGKNVEVVMALDSRPSWRHHYYQENCGDFEEYRQQKYKGNRPKMDISGKVFELMDEVHELLEKNTDLAVLHTNLAEGDDIIATLCTENKLDENVVVSEDRDYQQLMTFPNTNVWYPIKARFAEVEDPKRNLIIDILRGQGRKDNVFPVKKGMGPKTAEKMVELVEHKLIADKKMLERYKFNETLIDFTKIPETVSESILTDYRKVESQGKYNYINILSFFQDYNLSLLFEEIPLLKQRKSQSLF